MKHEKNIINICTETVHRKRVKSKEAKGRGNPRKEVEI
jgi:hypothetical protein